MNDLRDRLIGLIGKRDLKAAQALCREALATENHPEFLYLMAVIQLELSNPAGAVDLFRQAVRALPDRADVAYNYGVACQAMGETAAAAEQWARTVALHPGHVDGHFNLAKALDELGDCEGAVIAYEHALALAPDKTDILFNLANVLVRSGDPARAQTYYQQIERDHPKHVAARINHGMSYMYQGRPGLAVDHYRQALAIEPNSIEAHWNLANALLIQGKWQEGFAEYEWRLQRDETPKPDWPQPCWPGSGQGGDLTGKRLLLWVDQGVGDAIQFLRYVPLIAERAREVILFCQPELASLAATAPGIGRVVSFGETPEGFDLHAPLMSLAHLLGQYDPAASWTGPCFAPPPRTLDAPPGSVRIGLVWSGNPKFENNRNRSCPVEEFLPLLDLPGCAFFSLQVGDAVTAVEGVQDLGSGFSSFSDTAAAISGLDLVISVDTAVPHLAGALDKPVWLLLMADRPDWRWLRDRQESPWYPSMRIFRQGSAGDWTGVIAKVREALIEV